MHCNQAQIIPRTEQAVKSKLRINRMNPTRLSESDKEEGVRGKTNDSGSLANSV